MKPQKKNGSEIQTSNETNSGWAVELRRGRYIRGIDGTTGRVDEITSHPEESLLLSYEAAGVYAEDNADEGNEDGFPRRVFVVINTTVIIQ